MEFIKESKDKGHWNILVHYEIHLISCKKYWGSAIFFALRTYGSTKVWLYILRCYIYNSAIACSKGNLYYYLAKGRSICACTIIWKNKPTPIEKLCHALETRDFSKNCWKNALHGYKKISIIGKSIKPYHIANLLEFELVLSWKIHFLWNYYNKLFLYLSVSVLWVYKHLIIVVCAVVLKWAGWV